VAPKVASAARGPSAAGLAFYPVQSLPQYDQGPHARKSNRGIRTHPFVAFYNFKPKTYSYESPICCFDSCRSILLRLRERLQMQWPTGHSNSHGKNVIEISKQKPPTKTPWN
jgi:hypothetical protein